MMESIPTDTYAITYWGQGSDGKEWLELGRWGGKSWQLVYIKTGGEWIPPRSLTPFLFHDRTKIVSKEALLAKHPDLIMRLMER